MLDLKLIHVSKDFPDASNMLQTKARFYSQA